MAAVGDVGAYLDFWSDSFEAALNVPQEYAVLDSLNSLLAGATPLIERGHLRTVAGRGADGLRLLKARAFEVASGSASIFPRILREGFIGSAFILTCSQAGLSMELAAELAGQEVGVAAFLAVDRAQNSGWSEATIGYCNVMLQQHPPASTTYIVRPGDTLSAITRAQYGVTFQAIWPLIHLLNPKLNDPNRLLAGQCLILPALGGRKG